MFSTFGTKPIEDNSKEESQSDKDWKNIKNFIEQAHRDIENGK